LARGIWISGQPLPAVLRSGGISALPRGGDLGDQHSGSLGIRDCEFRLVDWDRPRRHMYLGHIVTSLTEMADGDKPVRRREGRARLACARPALSAPAMTLFLAGRIGLPISSLGPQRRQF